MKTTCMRRGVFADVQTGPCLFGFVLGFFSDGAVYLQIVRF